MLPTYFIVRAEVAGICFSCSGDGQVQMLSPAGHGGYEIENVHHQLRENWSTPRDLSLTLYRLSNSCQRPAGSCSYPGCPSDPGRAKSTPCQSPTPTASVELFNHIQQHSAKEKGPTTCPNESQQGLASHNRTVESPGGEGLGSFLHGDAVAYP